MASLVSKGTVMDLDKVFSLAPLPNANRKPLLPHTPVVAVPTAVRLEGESYFHQCDSNRSGTLDLYETVSLLQNAGFPGTSGQYEQFFEQIDTDKDGEITLQVRSGVFTFPLLHI